MPGIYLFEKSKIMMQYLGFFLLAFLVSGIIYLFVRRKRIEKAMAAFYQEHSIYLTKNEPPNVRDNLKAADNLFCCQGNLVAAGGVQIPFYWWEWYFKSNRYGGNGGSIQFDCHLAVSFAPNTVSDDFMQKAVRFADKSNAGFWRKLKDFFNTDTHHPYRAEKLADESFLICWHVLKRRDILESKIKWLKNNVSLPIKTEIAALSASKMTGTIFYKHDNYETLRRKFNGAWTNLHLELHDRGPKLDHEDRDEFADDATFADANTPNEVVFTLTDETIAETAVRLLEENCGGKVWILRDSFSVEAGETLEYCNNPFRLPLNVFSYGEFKRRFAERWTNLSIELYDASPNAGGLGQNSRELADDFEMKNLKNADSAYLHEYVYISTWSDALKNVQIAAAIKNNRLGIYCERNWIYKRLKEFQAAEKK